MQVSIQMYSFLVSEDYYMMYKLVRYSSSMCIVPIVSVISLEWHGHARELNRLLKRFGEHCST